MGGSLASNKKLLSPQQDNEASISTASGSVANEPSAKKEDKPATEKKPLLIKSTTNISAKIAALNKANEKGSGVHGKKEEI